MGAYKRGDIRKICDIVQPDISVITGINEQHIALFKTIEDTLRAKYEIVEYAKPEAMIILNGDNDLCLRIAGKSLKKELFYSINKELDVWASDIKAHEDFLDFNVHYKGESKRFSVKILGEHNVSNILAATCVAISLGMPLSQIAQSLEESKVSLGRLSQKRSKFGYLVIDDSYNSNPAGFIAALRYLKSLKLQKKILVTSGIIELGEKINEVYKSLSKTVIDSVNVLVTTDKKLVQFVQETNKTFPVIYDTGIEKQLYFLKNNVTKKDVVLFEGANARLLQEILNSKS
jgi:UDP-N-acetylmuramoyl-tripeptide--D-alanyl-D-alanine ligase